MKDLNQLRHDFRKIAQNEHESVMAGIIKREYPNITDFKVKYDLDKDSFEIIGLTPGQEAHVRKQPK